MIDEPNQDEEFEDDGPPETSERPQPRERSTIEFPYGDLDTAVTVARAIHNNAGLSCTTDQLAGYMRQSVSSGAFRSSVSTARVFGLVETERGSVSLTPLGSRAVDPLQERAARAEAFLTVPLYRAIFERHRGHTLPPAAALQREMAELGVAEKQKDRARQAFDRSAEQAGFFEQGRDRLVMPVARSDDAPSPPLNRPGEKADRGNLGAGGDSGGIGGSRKTIDLRSGGQIVMSVSVDPFALSRSDREFVFKLIDELSDYESRGEPKQLSAPRSDLADAENHPPV